MREVLSLREDGFTLEEIEDIFDISRSRALDDLRHLQKSLRWTEHVLLMVPPRCNECDFVIRAEEPKAPGRCPMCKSERMIDPVFKVEKTAT